MLPNEIMQGRFPRALQRFFGIQGPPPVPQLSPEVQAQLDVGPQASELSYLLDERLCAASVLVSAVVGQQSFAILHNPVSSGMLMVVDEVHGSVLTVTDYLAIIASSGITAFTAASEFVRDLRWTAGRTVGFVSSGNGAGAIGASNQLATVRAAADAFIQMPGMPVVLLPGDQLLLGVLTDNIAMVGGFSWRERALPELERAFG